MTPVRSKRSLQWASAGLLIGTLAAGALPVAAGDWSNEREDVGRRESGAVRSRPKTARRLPAPGLSMLTKSQENALRFELESSEIRFGEVVPDAEVEAAEPLAIRVFSDRNWTLALEPTSAITEQGRPAPISRLRWRSIESGVFSSFGELGTIVARGGRTGDAGQLVTVDLRLKLASEDPLGQYGYGFRLILESGIR